MMGVEGGKGDWMRLAIKDAAEIVAVYHGLQVPLGSNAAHIVGARRAHMDPMRGVAGRGQPPRFQAGGCTWGTRVVQKGMAGVRTRLPRTASSTRPLPTLYGRCIWWSHSAKPCGTRHFYRDDCCGCCGPQVTITFGSLALISDAFSGLYLDSVPRFAESKFTKT